MAKKNRAHGRDFHRVKAEELTFGIEVECVGIGIDKAITAVASCFTSSETQRVQRHRSGWGQTATKRGVYLNNGRIWQVVSDASLSYNGAEIVSPILKMEDLPKVQEIVRALRAYGAKVDHSCGIHIHVGAQGLDSKKLQNAINIFYRYDHIFAQALQISSRRRGLEGRGGFAKPLCENFVGRYKELKRSSSLEEINKAWYEKVEFYNPKLRRDKYNNTRYNGLNLHSFWFNGTVEFRLFNGTLHAGKIRAYVEFCLHLIARAHLTKCLASSRYSIEDAKGKKGYRLMTDLLVRLGFEADETIMKFMREGLEQPKRKRKKKPVQQVQVQEVEETVVVTVEEPAQEDYYRTGVCPF